MISILILVTVSALILLVIRHSWRGPNRQMRGRAILTVGFALGVTRAILVTAGWYTVEQTGGPLQIPAHQLAMLALPEVALLPREGRRLSTPPDFYLGLALLLIVSTMLVVSLVALVVSRRRAPAGGSPSSTWSRVAAISSGRGVLRVGNRLRGLGPFPRAGPLVYSYPELVRGIEVPRAGAIAMARHHQVESEGGRP